MSRENAETVAINARSLGRSLTHKDPRHVEAEYCRPRDTGCLGPPTIRVMSGEPARPSSQSPLGGGCLCGAIRYEITRPLSAARYCHCTHCQRRTGTAASANGLVPREGFALLSGREQLRSYKPPTGVPKYFCSVCGSALFSGDPFADEQVVVRLGTLDRDPGIRPQYRQFVDSAAPWESIPEDELPRYPAQRARRRARPDSGR